MEKKLKHIVLRDKEIINTFSKAKLNIMHKLNNASLSDQKTIEYLANQHNKKNGTDKHNAKKE